MGKTVSSKRRRTPTIFEDNAYPTPKVQKKTLTTPSSPGASTEPDDEDKQSRIEELYNKNKQCLDYISRTERLLKLIKSEQGRIQSELASIIDTKSTPDKSLLSAVNEEFYNSEVDTSDSGSDSTSADEYDDGDIDFSKCKKGESFDLPRRRSRVDM